MSLSLVARGSVVTVTLEQGADRPLGAATVTAAGTAAGVEMEALTAVTVTALTVYDVMQKQSTVP